MQYDPIKRTLGHIFTGPPFRKKLFYLLLDLLLLRAWHIYRKIKEISNLIPENASVLDAGCGFGQYTWRMGRNNRYWIIRGIDIDGEHIAECRKFFASSALGTRTSFHRMDLTLLSENDAFDLVLTVDVMEHINEDEKVFRNFYNALKNNGFLIISTPSDKGGSDVHDENDTSFIDEHVRDGYGEEEIKQKLSAAGFRDITTEYTYGKPGSISWRLSMKYPVKMLNISKLFLLILPFYYIIVFPVAFVLNTFDICKTQKTGTGLLVTAKK
ncbi:MAG: class I SAM-dependent methyltransferase [Bacteroidales bacterium]|nr:class I SAM-dependent methyltransferase [Bacteroidales bacterium]